MKKDDQIYVGQWWAALHKKLVEFEAKHKTFAEADKDFKLIFDAANAGKDLTQSKWSGLSDKSRGNTIKKKISELRGNNIPKFNGDYKESSQKFLEIYLEHLEGYQHVFYEGWQISGAQTFENVDLTDLSGVTKDISSLKAELKKASPVAGTGVTVTTTVTTTIHVTVPSVTEEKKPVETFELKLIKEKVRDFALQLKYLKEELKILTGQREKIDNSIKELCELNQSQKKKRVMTPKQSSEMRKLARTSVKLEKSIKDKKENITEIMKKIKEIETLRRVAERSPSELTTRCTDLLITQVVAKVESYQDLQADAQDSIKILLAEMSKDLEKQYDDDTIIESLASNINLLLEDKKPDIEQYRYAKNLFNKRSEELQSQIIAKIADYQKLDDDAKKAVNKLLSDVFKRPDFLRQILLKQDTSIFSEVLAKEIQTAIYGKWGARLALRSSQKGINTEKLSEDVVVRAIQDRLEQELLTATLS
jgi:hypothetical protein